ncbi:MAG: acetoin utilization protein AcuC [Candidatus Competibacteraceae bacterium]|nr:acetoin utilization protein AcuC [Candidatus Competibacteraceae bacterium]
MARSSRTVAVYTGDEVSHYGFEDHPFSEDRIHAFWDEMHIRQLADQVRILHPVMASEEQLRLFHTAEYVEKVKHHSKTGEGLLDYGDTPAYKGVYEDAVKVVGSVIDATHKVMNDELRRVFLPIAGLHHSMPNTASGFCVFNDVAVAIKVLQQAYGLERIAYVDIDAHHGDGVFYPFEADPTVIFADIHEDGRYNFPQSGFSYEAGKGAAKGRKLNIPLLPLSADDDFMMMWEKIEDFVRRWEPQFVFMNCGADGLNGDPLAHLHFTARAHARAARGLCQIAEDYAEGRIIGVGGGGYDLRNIANAWTAVVDCFLEAPMR